jgi:transketolase
VKKEKSKPDFTFFATGSEVSLALEVADRLEKMGKEVRVVSFPCWKLFDGQSDEYKDSILEGDIGIRVSIEAASDFGWHKYIGRDGIAICMETFGESAPAADLVQVFGFTNEAIVERLLAQD